MSTGDLFKIDNSDIVLIAWLKYLGQQYFGIFEVGYGVMKNSTKSLLYFQEWSKDYCVLKIFEPKCKKDGWLYNYQIQTRCIGAFLSNFSEF